MLRIAQLVLLVFALFSVTLAARAEPAINTNGSAYAIGGYDVVAYFTDAQPVKGAPKYVSVYEGAKWLFASADHKAMFDRQPGKYAPAYRGYCAYGVSRGYLVSIDPRAFTVLSGKLYLNYSLDVRDTWLADTATFIRKADRNFANL